MQRHLAVSELFQVGRLIDEAGHSTAVKARERAVWSR